MEENVTDYWKDNEQFAEYGYYFDKGKGIPKVKIPEFMDKYIPLGLKYGIEMHPFFIEN